MFDGMVRELKEVRYVLQVKKNLISVGTFEALGHAVFVRDGVLKITRVSMVMKSVRRNNLYYVMGSTVTGLAGTSISSDGDCTQVWHMRPGYTGNKEGIIGRCIYLQHEIGWTRRS